MSTSEGESKNVTDERCTKKLCTAQQHTFGLHKRGEFAQYSQQVVFNAGVIFMPAMRRLSKVPCKEA